MLSAVAALATGWVRAGALRWSLPASPLTSDGLGGAITWSEDAALCDALRGRFESESFGYFGAELYSFVSCEEITDALVRNFALWEANHRLLSFYLPPPHADAEVRVTAAPLGDAGPVHTMLYASPVPPLSTAGVAVDGVGGGAAERAIAGATVILDSDACYVMDASFCVGLQSFAESHEGGEAAAIRLALFAVYSPLVLAGAYLVLSLRTCARRARLVGSGGALHVAASLSYRWYVLALLG